MTTNYYLALYFEAKGITLDDDFSQIKENDVDVRPDFCIDMQG